MKGTGAKRDDCPSSSVSTGAELPVSPVESATVQPIIAQLQLNYVLESCTWIGIMGNLCILWKSHADGNKILRYSYGDKGSSNIARLT